jgi:plasmid maintenance system killer protein
LDDILAMIRSFPDKKTEGLFSGRMVREVSGFRTAAEWKPTMLDKAPELKDLRSLPGTRLEMVNADRGVPHQDQRSEADVFSVEGSRAG